MPSRPGPGRDGRPPQDAELERRVSSWLRDEPGRPPEALVDDALARSRAVGQRPAWLARWRDRGRGPAGRLLPAAAAVALVLAIVVLGSTWDSISRQPAVGASARPSGAPTGAPSAPASRAPGQTPFGGRIEARIDLDRRPTALGSGFGSLWVADEAGRLLRVDPAEGKVVATIELGGVACGPILPASTALWLATCGPGITTAQAITLRIDPVTNTVSERYADGGGDGVGVSAMNGLVWFISDVQGGRLTAVDADTGAHVRDLTVDAPVRFLTAGFGSLWVSPIGSTTVIRVDPENGTKLAEIGLSGDAGFLATAADSIWVAEPHQWLVGRIDPALDRLAGEAGAAPGVNELLVTGSGLVWVLADEEALAVDRGSSTIVDRFPVPRHVAFDAVATDVLAIHDDSVWFADETALLRLGAP